MPRRTNGSRGKGKTIIRVFCEGETEQAYTEFLKKQFADVAVIKYPKETGLFDEANNRFAKDPQYRDYAEVIDVALQDIDYKNRSCSIGIGIAKIKNRSNGYGSEAVRLILSYGFRFLPLERITANTADINIPCQSMLEHCGFKQEGRERKAMFLDGKWHDRYRFAILREEYETMC